MSGRMYGGLCLLVVVGVSVFIFLLFFFSMIRRPPRSTQSRSSAASDVYKRQMLVPLAARHRTSMLVKPLFTGVQFAPLFVDKNTPPPGVPANKLVPLMAIA